MIRVCKPRVSNPLPFFVRKVAAQEFLDSEDGLFDQRREQPLCKERSPIATSYNITQGVKV